MSRLILAAGVLGLPLVVAAQPQTPSQTLDRVGVDQRIGERVPLDLRFTDRHGDSVTLGNLIDGKPALLQLAWYDCPNLCDLSLRRLGSRLSEVKFQPGEDFRVITVSIDPREGADAAAMSSNFTSREERRRKEELDQARKVRAPTRPSRALL